MSAQPIEGIGIAEGRCMPVGLAGDPDEQRRVRYLTGHLNASPE